MKTLCKPHSLSAIFLWYYVREKKYVYVPRGPAFCNTQGSAGYSWLEISQDSTATNAFLFTFKVMVN